MDSDLLPHATEFSFLPEGASLGDKEVFYFTVTVSRRSNDLWAVLWMNHCWNNKSRSWEYEPRDRSKKFLRECRYTLEDAVQIARSLPDALSVNGKSWLDFKAIHARQEEARHVGA
jgi:hypothetical protein